MTITWEMVNLIGVVVLLLGVAWTLRNYKIKFTRIK
jgi:hypothetical protein